MSPQTEFDWLPHPLPIRWLPDETLYSLVSRFHRISGQHLGSATAEQLFGDARCHAAHDFPTRIDQFVARTRGLLGTADEIIRSRTLLPYFLPFRPRQRHEHLIAAARSGGSAHLIKYQAGLPASRFGAHFRLRLCPACAQIDESTNGVAHWQREHQLPGSIICRVHGEILREAQDRAYGLNRNQWLLPDDARFEPIVTEPVEIESYRQLTEGACAILALPPGFAFESAPLGRCYRRQATALGLLAGRSRLRWPELAERIVHACRPYRAVRGLELLPVTQDEAISQFKRLLNEVPKLSHPIRHLILAEALFGSWSSFIDAYQATLSAPDEAPVEPASQGPRTSVDPRRAELIAAYQAGQSPFAAGRLVGVSASTAIIWLAEAGCDIEIRSRAITPQRYVEIGQFMRRGKSKAQIIRRFGLSLSTFNRLIRQDQQLKADWQQARFERQRKVMRAVWTRTARRLPAAHQEVLKRYQPAVAFWLYANDRAWYVEFKGSLPRANRTGIDRIRWDQRDLKLSADIQAAAAELQAAGRRLRMTDLYDRVPTLFARMPQLDRLPLTRAVLHRLIKRRRRGDDVLLLVSG